MDKFIDGVFPTTVRTSGGQNQSLQSGTHKYSRVWRSREYMTQLFPGIEVSARSSVMKGGTFNSVTEATVYRRETLVKDRIKEILVAMKPLYDRGQTPAQIIAATKHHWDDRSVWERNGEPSPLHRSRADGGEPTLLVTPEQLVMLLPLMDPAQGDPARAVETAELRQIIDRLSTATAHVQVNDMLSDIYARALDRCKRDPQSQGVVAQENCDLIMERTKTEMDILAHRRDAERQARSVQVEIAGLVQEAQGARAARAVHRGSDLPSPATQDVKKPGDM